MEIGGPQVPNYIIAADGSILRCKVFDIGAWNMDTTGAKSIVTGIAPDKYVGILGWIKQDGLQYYYPIAYPDTALTSATHDLQFRRTDNGTLDIERRAGGTFDSVNFDDAGINRGTIIMFYRD